MDDTIIAAIPEIAREPALIKELHASTRAHWRSFLSVVTNEHRLLELALLWVEVHGRDAVG